MPTKPVEVNSLHAQLQARLVDSGEYDRIKSMLVSKLNESGWSDDLRHRTKEHARAMEPLSFQELFDEFAPDAKTTLPSAVEHDIMAHIRQYIEKSVA